MNGPYQPSPDMNDSFTSKEVGYSPKRHRPKRLPPKLHRQKIAFSEQAKQQTNIHTGYALDGVV